MGCNQEAEAEVRPQSLQVKASQGQNVGGWRYRRLQDRQIHRGVLSEKLSPQMQGRMIK